MCSTSHVVSPCIAPHPAHTRQYDQALEHYQRAIQIQPNYPQAHCNMGVIYKERGELEVAISCYEKALVASPNFAIVQVRGASGGQVAGRTSCQLGRVRERGVQGCKGW